MNKKHFCYHCNKELTWTEETSDAYAIELCPGCYKLLDQLKPGQTISKYNPQEETMPNNNISKYVLIFTDGNAPRKTTGKDVKMVGKVGWGYVKHLISDNKIVKTKEEYGSIDNATVDQAELMAILKGLEGYLAAVKEQGATLPLKVISDRENLVKGINEWMAGWKKRGWKKADKKPVANLEYWQAIDTCLEHFKTFNITVKVVHMRSHGKGNETDFNRKWNDRADYLAQIARDGGKA